MESLKEFKNFVDELNLSNSRNYKLDILNKYKDNDNIKYYLNFLYNTYITTGISDKKLNKKVPKCTDVPSLNIKGLLDFVKNNNTGTDNIIGIIQTVRDNLVEDQFIDLFNSIITKSLSLGIDVKSINKEMNNLIPTFNVQLANKYFENPDYVKGKIFALTTKIDGGRIIAIKENNQVNLYTRQGQKYEGLVDLEKEMLEQMPDNICLDGEITLLDPKSLTSKDQYKETMKITRKDGEKHFLKMLVFDIMTATDFKNQFNNINYVVRRSMLNELFNHDYKYFELLPLLYVGDDVKQIDYWLDRNINEGQEGVMINIWEAPYEFKRTNSLLKAKKFNSCDLRVIDLEEGMGKNKCKLGAFICEYKDNNLVKVGSGLSDNLRTEVWKNKDKYKNIIIEVSYFEETINSNGGKSLRFPAFKDFRFDKNEPNY